MKRVKRKRLLLAIGILLVVGTPSLPPFLVFQSAFGGVNYPIPSWLANFYFQFFWVIVGIGIVVLFAGLSMSTELPNKDENPENQISHVASQENNVEVLENQISHVASQENQELKARENKKTRGMVWLILSPFILFFLMVILVLNSYTNALH